jgi:hypothetical protein
MGGSADRVAGPSLRRAGRGHRDRGFYDIIAYLALSRRYEIGIRLSFGSTRTQIVMLVLCESLRPLVVELLMALPLGAGAVRAANTLFFGLSVTDPPTAPGAKALLAIAGAVAGSIRAWRAAGVDPCIALRCD